MPNQSEALDRVFHALSNSTRRQVVARLGTGPARLTDLAEPFDMALPSFLQHMQVLEGSGLVTSAKAGRIRTYELDPSRLIEAEHWLDVRRREWGQRLDQLNSFLLELKEST